MARSLVAVLVGSALVCSASGCTRLACYAPETCASICGGAATPGLLDDACQCVVSCDLGMCSSVPYCPP